MNMIDAWRAVGEVAPKVGMSKGRAFSEYALRPRLPIGIRSAARQLRGLPELASETQRRNPTIQADFARRTGIEHLYAAWRGQDQREAVMISGERALHIHTLTFGGHQTALEENHRLANAVRIEARHPFRDRRLVEFCVGLPPNQKLRLGWTRFILREALKKVLPPDAGEMIAGRRDKVNFASSIHYEMLTANRELLDSVILYDAHSLIAPYVEINALRAVYRELLSTAAGDSAKLHQSVRMTYQARAVRRAVMLALWLKWIPR
jgi:asparagine synthase (glutamine-hydrolysing)